MPKRVRMVAEILSDKCTGCRLCEQVCPTVAITMRDRRDDEPGPGRRVAELDGTICYNAQTCFEICPDDAIEMHVLPEPFDVELDRTGVTEEQIAALCAKVGYPPGRTICLCTDTTAGELAAAVLKGANTPDAISRMTGARTGCVELCLQPVIEFALAAGDGDAPKNPKNGYQWYGRSVTLFEKAGPEGFPKELVDAYPAYPLDRELVDLARLVSRSSED